MCEQPVELPVLGSDSTYTVRPSKIICLGLNYRDHIAESVSVNVRGFTHEEPPEPVLFPKLPSSLVGPGENIVIPSIVDTYDFDEPRTDYEGELAVIISRTCRNVDESEALSCVFGYTCSNDVSQRNIQTGDRTGWFRGKSFDTFAPIGPAILPAASCKDVQDLELVTRLNGKVVQSTNTSLMINSVARTIAFVSRNFTLCEGDVLLTGTPAGVGPVVPGDTVEVEVSGIGVLENPVVAEAVPGEYAG